MIHYKSRSSLNNFRELLLVQGDLEAVVGHDLGERLVAAAGRVEVVVRDGASVIVVWPEWVRRGEPTLDGPENRSNNENLAPGVAKRVLARVPTGWRCVLTGSSANGNRRGISMRVGANGLDVPGPERRASCHSTTSGWSSSSYGVPE